MNALTNFAVTEREFYADKDINLFAFSLSQAIRYYEFILLVYKRHDAISQRMVSHHKDTMQSISTQDGRALNEEHMRLFEESARLNTEVHLEIESFYLFAKIFLDMIARFILNYFGEARGIKLNSHDRLTKSHKEYQNMKGLVLPPGFSDSLALLKEQVCDYRDKQISHLQNLRTVKGIAFNISGQTRITATHLYPNPKDARAETREIPDIMAAIDQYIQQVIAFIEMNRSKTRFTIREQNEIH